MISARWFILIAMIFVNGYELLLTYAADIQRKKPLRAEVADVYDPERYQKYLDFTADKKKINYKYKIINFILDIILVFSPVYAFIERACHSNPYLLLLANIWGCGQKVFLLDIGKRF